METTPHAETAGNAKNPKGPQNFTLRQARLWDLGSIARVWHRAFFDDEIIGDIMHPNRRQYPEHVYWFLLRGVRERFWDWRHQFMVVVTKDTRDREVVVGAADWRRLGRGGARRELFRLDPREDEDAQDCLSGFCLSFVGNLIKPVIHAYQSLVEWFFPNRAADPSQASWLDTAVASSEVHWTGDRTECWDLHVCGVDPEYQGKGVGKLLAQWGVNEAEKEGSETCASVLCGEKNRGFYGKAGLTVQVGRNESEGGGIALFTR